MDYNSWKQSQKPCFFIYIASEGASTIWVMPTIEDTKQFALEEFPKEDCVIEIYKVDFTSNQKQLDAINSWEELSEKISLDKIGSATPLLIAQTNKSASLLPGEFKYATYGEKYQKMAYWRIKMAIRKLEESSRAPKEIYDIREFGPGDFIKVRFVAMLGKDYDTPEEIEVDIPVKDLDLKQDRDSWFYIYNYSLDTKGTRITFEIWGTQDAFGNPRLRGLTMLEDGTLLHQPRFGVNVLTNGDIGEQISEIEIMGDAGEWGKIICKD